MEVADTSLRLAAQSGKDAAALPSENVIAQKVRNDLDHDEIEIDAVGTPAASSAPPTATQFSSKKVLSDATRLDHRARYCNVMTTFVWNTVGSHLPGP